MTNNETNNMVCIDGDTTTIPMVTGVTVYDNVLTANSLYEMLNGRKDTVPANCKNCGAPLNSHKCEYCGTEY